jgi:hypothetical protein
MKVKELIKLLVGMDDLDAVIDMSSDSEGNSYGDITEGYAEGKLFNGEKVYTLYPSNSEMPEDRYLEMKAEE